MTSFPKSPADYNKKLRELAEGEACTLMFPDGACDPATTVWAHPNTLAHNKGMGYKADDSAGVFACYRCHKIIDQPGSSDPGPEQREDVWEVGWLRTTARLREIADSPTMRPWKQRAARWALERRLK